MKRYVIAAGALLLGTSTGAWAGGVGATGKAGAETVKTVAKSDAIGAAKVARSVGTKAIFRATVAAKAEKARAVKLAAVDAKDGAPGEIVVTHHSAYGGVGGPIVSQSGYPPCDPGPGDDRCIQLYEPGVTGAGN